MITIISDKFDNKLFITITKYYLIFYKILEYKINLKLN